MKWSSDTIDKIREAHDIVEWVGRDTALKSQSNNQYSGLCPFPDHKEKTPSFSVSAVKQVYYCFGCQRGGDIFTYFRDLKGMSFPSIVQYLAGQAGIALHQTSKDLNVSKRDDCFKMNRRACDFFHQKLLELPSTHPAVKYLKFRGYSKEIIQKFHLGYASQKGNLTQHFSSDQKKWLIEVGLVKEKGMYDIFRHRLIFPIFSPINRVLGFGGRSLDSSLPKYINSKDSICFQKGRIFYGLNESAGAIRQQGYALVVEGYTDFLTLFQNGFRNVVATLGTALTSYHARLCKRYTDKVVLFFDGDSAGEKAALRSLPLLLAEGLRVHCSELKDMDPDECVRKHGVEFLKKTLSQNQDLFLHIFSKKLKSAKDVERLDILQYMSSFLFEVKNEVLKEYYTRRLLDIFSDSEQKMAKKALKQYRNEYLNKKSKGFIEIREKQNFQSAPSKISLQSMSKSELYLLVLSLHRPSYLAYIASQLNLSKLSHSVLKKIFSVIFDRYSKDKTSFDKLLSQMTGRVEPEFWLQPVSHPVLKDLDEKEGMKLIDDCLTRVSLNYENIRLKTLVMQLKLDQSNKQKYLNQIQNIKKHILSMEKK